MIVVGNLIGMAVFGFFVLMGQQTAVSQMVLSRAAFGRRGAYLPALMQGLLAVGWCAINTWIILDLVIALFDKIGIHGGDGLKIGVAIVIMAIQVWLAAIGFRAIARFERWTVPITIVVLIAMTIVAWTQTDVDWGYAGGDLHGKALWSSLTTLMTAIGIGWGITWFAYASDYSRFVSLDVPRRKLYLGSVLGQFLPTVWLGVFGATLATITTATDPGKIVVDAFGALAIPVILLVIHGPIATNVLNIYSCALCAQTLDWKVERRTLSYGVGVLATLFTIYLILHGYVRRERRRLAGRTRHLGGALGRDHAGALLRGRQAEDRRRRAVRAAGLAEGPGHRVGGDHPVPARHGGHLDVRVRRPELPAGSDREEHGWDRPVLAGGIHRRRRAVLRRALTTPGTLVDGHRRGLTA